MWNLQRQQWHVWQRQRMSMAGEAENDGEMVQEYYLGSFMGASDRRGYGPGGLRG